MTDTTTNPVGGEDTASATPAPDAGVDADGLGTAETLFDDDGNPIAPPEDEEEVELDDGLKLKVPKTAAEKLKALQEGNLRQADYTRKTQEVAELRRAVETERQTIHQASDAEIGALATVRAIDQELAKYANADWNRHFDENPLAAPRDWAEFQQLQQTRAQAAGQYGQLRGQRELSQQQETAKLVETARAELAADPEIKWTPQKAAEIMQGAKTHYKLDATEVDEGFRDARLVRILHDGLQWRAHLQNQKKAQGHVKAQEVAPAATVGRASAAPPQGLDDQLSTEAWIKRRDAQAKKRA